ncbi:MAG: DUF2279 domain-containing protein [Gammaproteobacteria bacterium]
MTAPSIMAMLAVISALLFPTWGGAAPYGPDDGACRTALPCVAALSNEPMIAANTGVSGPRSTRNTARTRALIGGAILATGVYGYHAWWKDAGGDFRLSYEGGFGEHTYAGGVDKLGHMYIGYAGTRLLTRGLEWAGNDHRRALRLSALTVGGIQLGIEVVDGFDRGSGFSIGDAVANITGLGLALLMETNPRLDEIFDLRVLYKPSQETRRQGKFDHFGDYSGQTYLLIVKASAFPSLARHKGTRYLELALGYGAVGFEPPEPVKRRSLYYGVSINLSQLLDDTAFADRRHPTAQAISHQLFEYIQLPGTVSLAGKNF